MNNMNTPIFERLSATGKGQAAAFRSITTLQPVGGVGDEILPASFAEGKYAEETRRVNLSDPMSNQLRCILVDSVASQANRAEEAPLAALRSGELVLRLIEVNFSEATTSLRVSLPNLTSLEVPLRLADPLLRDSQIEDSMRFSKTKAAASWEKSTMWDATGIYELCPTALLSTLLLRWCASASPIARPGVTLIYFYAETLIHKGVRAEYGRVCPPTSRLLAQPLLG